MTDNAVAIAAIVMLGVLLSVIAWQLLAIARTAVDREKRSETEQLRSRLHALEALHDRGDDQALQGDQVPSNLPGARPAAAGTRDAAGSAEHS